MRRPALSWRAPAASAIVLCANVVIMSVELLATRLLFPRYGDTIFTWSTVISIIIAGLFLGYMAGGSLAERRRAPALLCAELCAGGALVAAVPWVCDRLLIATGLPAPLYPPLAGCFLVFGLPAACLAAVPPAAVGLLVEEGLGAAWSAGVVSALAAAGSVVGTLGTTFYLIPHFGVRSLFVCYGAALGVLALVARAMGGRASPVKAAAAALVYIAVLAGSARADGRPPRTTVVDPIFSKESAYQLVRVFERGKGPDLVRLMMLDSTEEGAMRMSDQGIVFDYTEAYKAFVNAFGAKAAPRLLFIGGGAYTMPIRTARELPLSKVEVAEVDPAVRDAAARYFGAGGVPNLSTVLADGRQALRGKDGAYDGVFVDAYHGVYAIPFELTTREFFTTLKDSLKPDGVAAFNVIGPLADRDGLVCSMTKTLASVFPKVMVYPTRGFSESSQNLIIVADKRADGPAGATLMKGTPFTRYVDASGLACRADTPMLTDDYAPAEWLVARYLKDEQP